MSIPTLCQACYKHYRSTVVKACPFCSDVQFPEKMLCDLVREGQCVTWCERVRARSSPFVVRLFDQRYLIDFTIRYHVVLSTRQRVNVFASEHREQIADMVRQAALSFEQTTAHVLWLASDHLHLYIDASPDYALDEIVHAIREHLEHAMMHLLPALPHNNQQCWERAYFAEGIG